MRILCGLLTGVVVLNGALHRDPAGFEVDLPPAWKVTSGQRGFVTISSPDERAFAQVIPVLGRQQSCAAFLPASFAVPSRKFPGAKVLSVMPGRDGRSALAEVAYDGGRAAVLCAETGPKSAMVYSVAAASAAERAAMIRMLGTFRYGGGTGAASQAEQMRFGRWSDPAENAFSLEIPQGWSARGGVIRYSNLEIGMGVRVASPDGRTVILAGDPQLRRCVTPYAGIRNGTMQGGTYFLNYIPAGPFAEQYLTGKLLPESGMQAGQILQRRDRADLMRAANLRNAQTNVNPGGPPQSTIAEVSFTARRGAENLTGYLLVSTTLNPAPDRSMGLWEAGVLGYITPAGELQATGKIMERMLGSIQVNPQWSQGTQAAGAAAQRAYYEASQRMSESITSGYWARQQPAAQARQSDSAENFSDMMRGQVRLTDGQGTEYVAPSGKNYYYLDTRSGVIGGTDTALSPPPIDVRQLEAIR